MYMDDGNVAYDYLDAFADSSRNGQQMSGNGWSYNSRTDTLILNGFNGSLLDFFDYSSYQDYRDREFTIELVDGSINYITYSNEQKDFYYYYNNQKAYFSYEQGMSIFGIGKNVTIKGNGQLIIDSTNASNVYALHLWNGESINLDSNLVVSGGTSVGSAEELKLGKISNQLGVECTGSYLVTKEGIPATYVRICPSVFLQALPNSIPVSAALDSTVAPYYSFLLDPLFYHDLYRMDNTGFDIVGNNLDIIDHGSFYELKNQYLYNFKVYDLEEEAMQSDFYKLNNRSKVEQHPCGKYIVSAKNKGYETIITYFGSLYIDKNVTVSYSLPDPDNPRRGSMMSCTWEEYFALPASVTNCYNGAIVGYVDHIDERGYITGITMTQTN